MNLGCAEFAVPGHTFEEKLKTLESRRMWLELVNDGIDGNRLADILQVLPSFNVPVRSVQAYRLHELQLLSGREDERKAALSYVEDTLKVASKVGAVNVVTTLAYGEPEAENPRRRCVEMYRRLGKVGKELNVLVSIEPLGKARTKFLPSVTEVYRLVREIGSEQVQPMVDTMHIHTNGEDVGKVVSDYADEISELQLRDTDSKPPGAGKIDFTPVMKVIRERFTGLTCLEYRPGTDPRADFDQACRFVSDAISEAR